ncbi:hypothetical protein Tco_1070718 [Tanacetum coccineum]|uniref:Uncharacterized protein n=1 Tax=Tanacetum coccineum TaxID=301880 RepID=A0ABQ5HM81_9ASTR
MLLTIKDEVGSNLKDEENDFMLDNSYEDEILEELTVAVIMMAQIQLADENADECVKRKTIIHTSDDDQIDSNIMFDDLYVENNGDTSEHDSNAHDEYHDIQMLTYNVQREAENPKRLNNELKRQKEFLQPEFKTFKDWVKIIESKTIQCSKYKETCEELEREIRADKDTIERILKEKDKIESDFLDKNEKIIIQIMNTQLAKMLSKNEKMGYLEDISQPKMYNGDMFYSVNLKIDPPDSDETLEDAEESRLEMRNKIVQINYGKLNALYETFVAQQELYVGQTYFSIPSTYNNGSEPKDVTLDLSNLKMPKESKLLKMFDTMGVAINGLQTRIDKTLLDDRQRRWMSDNQNSLR